MGGRRAVPWRQAMAIVGSLGVLGGFLSVAPLAVSAAAAPTTFVVGTTVDDPTLTTCSSTQNAACSLRGALDLALSMNTTSVIVTVPPGVYGLTKGALAIASTVTLQSQVPGRQAVIDGSGNLSGGLLVIDPTLAICPPAATTCLSDAHHFTVSLSNITVRNATLASQPTAATSLVRAPYRTTNAAGIDLHPSGSGGSVALGLTDVAVTGNTNTALAGNAAPAGGIYLGAGDSATLTRVLVSGNGNTSASGGAGGLTNNAQNTVIVNSTFTKNSGRDAGAIEQDTSGLFLGYDTIAGNTATGAEFVAGAVLDNDGSITLQADVLGGTSAAAANKPSNCANTLTSQGHNVDSDGSCVSGNATDKVGTAKTPLDTGLQPLAWNGGPADLLTMGLGAGSPAIGLLGAPCPAVNGANDFSASITVDARSFPRPDLQASSGTKSTTCDAGAFEVQVASSDPGQFTKGPQPPPGGFTPEFPAGGATLPDPIPQGGATLTASDPQATGVSVTLLVPQGSLPGGTQVAFYHGVASVLNTEIPSGKTTVDGLAVAWVAPDGTRPDSNIALTMTVKDPAVPAGGSLFLCKIAQTGACTTPAPNSTVQAGQWSAQFTADPGFVLAQAAAAPTPTPAPAVVSAPTVGGGAASGPPALPLEVLLGILATLGLAGLVRRRRS